MLNFFKDLLFKEKVLLLSVLFSGIFLRLFSLSEVSSWSDEVATWYFSNNLNIVFKSESHTPVYYFLCKLWMTMTTDSIFSIRLLSIFLSYLLMFTSVNLLRKSGKYLVLSLVTFWSLFPTFIIYDRQARHYGLFAELVFLLFVVWEDRKRINIFYQFLLIAFIQMVHPLGVIPVLLLVLIELSGRHISFKQALIYLSASLPMSFYYLSRLYFHGFNSLTSNVSWIKSDFNGFFKSLLLLFAGDSFPFTTVFPISFEVFAFCFLFVLFVFLYFSNWRVFFLNKRLHRFLFTFFSTILIVEALTFAGINLRIGRYYIYLVPCLLSFLMTSVNDSHLKQFYVLSVLAVLLATYSFFIFKPWKSFLWDDHFVSAFKRDYLPLVQDKNLLICGNAHLLKYHFNRQYSDCTEEAFSRYYLKKDFSVFDMRGSQSTMALSLYLSNLGQVVDRKFFGHAFFFRFERHK